ncbi:metal-dependent phosphoesterase [Euryarchaeota archaeon ex4484_162]|nr:MAG: metal-dependent phosphoesterase [Euryarchaeota archaeon ex4484_162]RLF62938.1 MAG: metal-dependent phosphoesterase [Thermoplasmata archaeon]HDM24971.1 PHP domain-containing protein [Thermoplasmatales archaeon]
MSLKMDLHVHSKYSEDGNSSVEEIVKTLRKKGFQGVAITDHNEIKGALKALKLAEKDFVVIPGIEISTSDGHLIGLGVKEIIPRGLSVEETVEKIIETGGVPVVPHLFRTMSGIKKEKLRLIYKKVPAIEVFNSYSLSKTNVKVKKIAIELKLGGTGGSDAHEVDYVGYGYTIVRNMDLNIDSILSEIQNKKTWGEGRTLPLDVRRDRVIKAVKDFFRRGFRRI